MPSRRDEIIELAKGLFAERGVQETSMRDLAEVAGILPSSLYSHFKSKEALADEILHDFLRELVARFGEVEATRDNPLERLRALLSVTIAAIESDPAALSIYRRDYQYLVSLPRFGYLYELHIEIRRIWIGTIELAMAEGYLRADVDPVVFYRWVRDALTFTPRWHRAGEQPAIGELAVFAERVFLDGMATKPTGD
jgi:TetR/AcrR family transcriptional regulator, cholesterol catabolism regulator